MALLKFLKGNYASLSNAAIAEGQILICGDTREMFVDIDASTRIKIGDFITVADMSALPAANSVPTSRLYYVEDGNILARSNGTDWVQINKQRTAEELKTLLGLGSLAYLSEVAYENLAEGLKTTIDTAVSDLDKLEAYVGEIPVGENGEAVAATVIAYVDKKTDGIATDENLQALAERVTTAEGDIDSAELRIKALEDANAEGGEVDQKIDAAQQAAETAQAGVDALNEKVDVTGKVSEAITEAKESVLGTDVEGNVHTGTVLEAKTAADNAQAAADKAQGEIDALEGVVGEVAEGKTVVGMISEAQEALQDDIGELSAAVDTKAAQADYEALAERVTTAEGEIDTLQSEMDAVEDKAQANEDAIALLNNNAETEGSVDYKIAQAVAGIMENPDETMNSINELVTWTQEHAQDALELSNQVTANKNDIATLKGDDTVAGSVASAVKAEADRAIAKENELSKAISDQATSDAATYETKTDAEGKLTEAKEYADGLNTAMDTRVKVLEAIEHDAYIAADEANLAAAKGYTDEKNTAMDNRVKVLEAIDHDAYIAADETVLGQAKAYTDELANGAVKTNADDIDALEGRMDTAEGALDKLNGGADVEGSVAKALVDAKAYTDELKNGQVETNKTDIASILAQLEWGSF